MVIDGITEIGSRARIAPFVTIGLAPGSIVGPTIGGDVQIGTGAQVLGRVEIGDAAVVGANAVVVGDVGAGVTVAGTPAAPVGAAWAASRASEPLAGAATAAGCALYGDARPLRTAASAVSTLHGIPRRRVSLRQRRDEVGPGDVVLDVGATLVLAVRHFASRMRCRRRPLLEPCRRRRLVERNLTAIRPEYLPSVRARSRGWQPN